MSVLVVGFRALDLGVAAAYASPRVFEIRVQLWDFELGEQLSRLDAIAHIHEDLIQKARHFCVELHLLHGAKLGLHGQFAYKIGSLHFGHRHGRIGRGVGVRVGMPGECPPNEPNDASDRQEGHPSIKRERGWAFGRECG